MYSGCVCMRLYAQYSCSHWYSLSACLSPRLSLCLCVSIAHLLVVSITTLSRYPVEWMTLGLDGSVSSVPWQRADAYTPHKHWGTSEVSKFTRRDLSNKLR